jgi:2-methylisocitrate lyase-like PEP mutase family enzyme
VCEAVDRPVNVLAHTGLTMAAIAGAGAKRVSVGGALTWVAVNAMVDAAQRMRDDGDFSALTGPGQIREWLAS